MHAIATQSPTVIVKAGLIDDDLTISGLSPVALIDNPSLVLRKKYINKHITVSIIAIRMNLLHSVQNGESLIPLNNENTVSTPKIDTFDDNQTIKGCFTKWV